MAEPLTLLPARRRSAGPVETSAVWASAGPTAAPPLSSDYAAGILLRLEGGARGVLTVSQVSPGRRNALSFEVSGARSGLAWDSERPEELWLGHRGRPNELLMRDPALLGPAAAGHTSHPGGHAEGFPDTFKELYRAVYTAIAAGGPPEDPVYPTFADGHEQALVGEAIARSAESGTWATVADTDTDTDADVDADAAIAA